MWATLLCIGFTALAQTPAVKTVVGTVTSLQSGGAELVVMQDSGESPMVRLVPETTIVRVAPGEKDLKNAKPVPPTEIAAGDRVLVTLVGSGNDARRIVLMSQNDIGKREEAERQEWIQHGVSGIVTAKNPGKITLRTRLAASTTPGTAAMTTVVIRPLTVFRRYSADSIRFTDAKKSNFDEVSVGDQLRTRGEKSNDGSMLTAEEVVFGTFVTNAGLITSVNAATREITFQNLATNQPLIVKLNANSQIRKFSASPTFFAAATGGGITSGGSDISQILEVLPSGTFADASMGDTIIVASSKGTESGPLNAITLIVNAQQLLQLVLSMGAASQGGGAAPDLSGLAVGLNGFGLGIIR